MDAPCSSGRQNGNKKKSAGKKPVIKKQSPEGTIL
jgi:hypothetical protein